jgi:hypothetical protein
MYPRHHDNFFMNSPPPILHDLLKPPDNPGFNEHFVDEAYDDLEDEFDEGVDTGAIRGGGGRRNIVFVNTNKSANNGYNVVIEKMTKMNHEEDEIYTVSNNNVGFLHHPCRSSSSSNSSLTSSSSSFASMIESYNGPHPLPLNRLSIVRR